MYYILEVGRWWLHLCLHFNWMGKANLIPSLTVSTLRHNNNTMSSMYIIEWWENLCYLALKWKCISLQPYGAYVSFPCYNSESNSLNYLFTPRKSWAIRRCFCFPGMHQLILELLITTQICISCFASAVTLLYHVCIWFMAQREERTSYISAATKQSCLC